MQVKYDLVVDFARPNKSNTIIISEGDVNSRVCHFILLNNKIPFSMGDVNVATVRGVKKDGSVIYGDAQILEDESGNKLNEVEYVIPASVADEAGDVTMTITLLSTGNEQLTSFEFYLKVRNALFNEDDVISESDLSGFRDLLNRALTAVEKVEQMADLQQAPNPYPLNITLEGEDISYRGDETVEMILNGLTYIAEGISEIEDAIDETAAEASARYAEMSRGYSEASQGFASNAMSYRDSALGYSQTAEDKATDCQGYVFDARLEQLKSEGYALGTQNGLPVPETSPYYHNNSKYYNENQVASIVAYDNSTSGAEANNVQDAIDQAFQYGNNRKEEVVEAIVAKGGTSSTTKDWDGVISDIDTIPSGSGHLFSHIGSVWRYTDNIFNRLVHVSSYEEEIDWGYETGYIYLITISVKPSEVFDYGIHQSTYITSALLKNSTSTETIDFEVANSSGVIAKGKFKIRLLPDEISFDVTEFQLGHSLSPNTDIEFTFTIDKIKGTNVVNAI